MQKNMKTTGYLLLIGFVLLLYTVAFIVAENVDYKYLGNNFNLYSYVLIVLAICVFIALFLIIYFRLSRRQTDITNTKLNKTDRYDSIMAALMILFGVVFLYLIYYNENGIYPQNSGASYLRSWVNKPVYAIFICALFTIFLYLASNDQETSARKRWLVILLFAFLCAAKTFAPNPFSYNLSNCYHMHAYTNSIIITANFHPFDWNNISIYGHYALLYLPFVKLFGNDYTAVALAIALFTFITYFSVFVVCNDWIKNDSVFILSVIAICAIPYMIYTSIYFQVNPQRLLFPAVTLCLISRTIKSGTKGFRLWLYEFIVGALAIIWNLETGVFSVAVLCGYNFVQSIREKVTFSAILKIIGKDIAFALIAFCGAYLVVNAYSFLTGATEWMSIKRFIYPMDSLGGTGGTYKVTSIRTGFVTPFSIYVLQLIIFSIVLLNGCHALFSRGITPEYKNSRIMLLAIAMSGFSNVVYFVNRAAYTNISITWPQMVLVLGIFGSEDFSKWKRLRNEKKPIHYRSKIAGKLVMLLYVFVLAIETGIRFEPVIKGQVSTHWKTEEVDSIVAEWNRTLPDDILGMGMGIPELFFQAHRNDTPSIRDWADMDGVNYQKAMELLDEAITQEKPILLGPSAVIEEYILNHQYEKTHEYQMGETVFQLMSPSRNGI